MLEQNDLCLAPLETSSEMSHRLRLDQELQDKNEQIQLVDEVARILTTTLDIDQVYDRFAEEQSDDIDSLPKGNETILLAEDEPMVCNLMSMVLREQGYQVLAAADGAEAIRLFQENTDGIDLLVTDVVMPNLTGPELAERLRSEQPELKVVFTSGYTRETTFQDGALAPGMEFLQKPYLPQVLVGKVREMLNAHPSKMN